MRGARILLALCFGVSLGGGQLDITLLPVLRSRKFVGFLLARAFTDVVWLFYLFWLPGYFQEVRGFDLALTGKLLWRHRRTVLQRHQPNHHNRRPH
jgi:hypothetical protein